MKKSVCLHFRLSPEDNETFLEIAREAGLTRNGWLSSYFQSYRAKKQAVVTIDATQYCQRCLRVGPSKGCKACAEIRATANGT